MNSISVEQQNGHGDDQQNESRLKNLKEMIKYAPHIRFFWELAVILIIYFQILYIQLAYDFPFSVSMIPILLYSCFQIWTFVARYMAATENGVRYKNSQLIINWAVIVLYQVE